MYIFNLFHLLHSYNPSFLICLCFNMASFRDQRKAWATLRPVSFKSLIQNFLTSIPTPFICGVYPPPRNFNGTVLWYYHRAYILLICGKMSLDWSTMQLVDNYGCQ